VGFGPTGVKTKPKQNTERKNVHRSNLQTGLEKGKKIAEGGKGKRVQKRGEKPGALVGKNKESGTQGKKHWWQIMN